MKIPISIALLFLLFSSTKATQNYHFITIKELSMKDNIVSIVEKETLVKGERHDLIIKNVNSETFYDIISGDTAIIKTQIHQGITSNYFYSKDNKLVELNNTNTRNANPTGKTTYHYDNKGNLKYELVFSASGRLKDSIATDYNPNELSKVKSHFTRDGHKYKTEEI